MKNKILAMFLYFLAICGIAHSEEIMYWMVNESATVDDTSISIFLSDYPEDDTHWSAARIKVTGPGIGMRYLDIESPEYGKTSGEEGAWIGDAGDGYGVSTGNWATQSPLALDGIDQELFKEAMFSVELGYLTWDEVLDVVDWVTLAETDPIAKSALSQYLYERGTLLPPGYEQYVPTDFHTVPEPSSGISPVCCSPPTACATASASTAR